MANQGKYVRSKEDREDDMSDHELQREASPDGIDGRTSHNHSSESSANCSDASTHEDSENESSTSSRSSASNRSSPSSTRSVRCTSDDEEPKTTEANANSKATSIERENPEKLSSGTSERMQQIEKLLADLSKAVTLLQPSTTQPISPEVDQSWNFGHEPPVAQSSYTAVRPEHIKPFPCGVRPNKMWAEWYDFIENFEVAVSLHNANDPVYKVKLLYLSLGQELQAIVNAAYLRPSLSDPHCYTTYVKNIENHLRSMTDTAAEHRAFLKMKQGRDESTIAFHARLIKNVKLCGYSANDQSRFVRAQLLDGLRNKELVKAARTYGHDTKFIVQSSTRDEAYEAEIVDHSIDTNVMHIGQGYGTNRKRINTRQESGYPFAKHRRINVQPSERQSNPSRWEGNSSWQTRENQFNSQTQGRRKRCPRCNNVSHRNPQCPALSRTCDKCGKRGHFAVACRTGKHVQHIAKHSDVESSGEENHGGEKQVKQC